MNEQEKLKYKTELLNKKMHIFWENMCAYSSDYYDIWKALRLKVDNAFDSKKTAKQIVSILKRYKTPKKFQDRKEEFEMQKNKLIDKFDQFDTGNIKVLITM